MELQSCRRSNRRIVRRAGAVTAVVVAVSSIFVLSSTHAWTPTTPQVTVSAFGGVDTDVVTDIARDSSGNIYTVGYFQTTIDVNPGTATTHLVSAGDVDIFVTKLDSSGDLVWAHRFGASNTDQANSVAVNSAGDVFITGHYSGTVDFNPSPSVTNNLVSAGAWDAFVVKLTSAGDFAWAESFGHGSANDSGTAIAVEASTGHPVVSGFFAGTVDFDNHPSTSLPLSASSGRIFIIKLTSSGGGLIWGGNVGGSSNDESSSLVVDAAGATYVVGQFQGSRDFDPSGATTTLTSAGNTDAFILKLNIAGAFQWAYRIGGTDADLARSIAVDASANVTVSGDFRDTVDLNPDVGIFNLTSTGMSDAFIVQLAGNGSFRWARHIGGSNIEFGQAVALDNSANVYLTGRFHGSNADFNPSPTATNAMSAVGGADVYVLKLDPLGMFSWVKKFGSWGTDEGTSILTDSTGDVFVAGRFENTVAFDPDNSSPTIASAGGTDSFVAKMTSSGVTAVTAAPTTAASTTVAPTTVAPATTVAAGSPVTSPAASATATSTTVRAGSATTTTVARGIGATPRVTTTTVRGTPSGGSATTTTMEATTTSAPSVTTTTTAAETTPPPDDDTVGPGATGITRDGSPTDAEVVEENGTLVVTMDGSTFTYSATAADGGAKSVSKAGFTLTSGDSVSIAVAGLGDTASAVAWLHPEGREVGNAALSGGAGTVTVTFDDSVEPGDKRLVLVAFDRAGRELNVTQGLRISADESSGTSWSLVFLVIVGMAAVAAFLVPAARRRRDDEETATAR